jgi:uncharacterized protein YutE (UPF0331/DUF86 family)
MEKKEMRYKRYRDKISYIVDHLEHLPQAQKTRVEKSATFYDLHTSIEAAIDLIAMYLKDKGVQVDDDYTNLEKLLELNLDSELISNLKQVNGLRNYLVHRYNTFDEKVVLNAIPAVKKTLYQWIDIIEAFLDEAGFKQNS